MLVATVLALLTPEAPFIPGYLESSIGAGSRHQACVRLIVEDIEEGRSGAQRWAAEGGGAPAQHCLAIADLAAGYPKLAAIRLRDLADRADAGDDATRARILAQSALAWLEAKETKEAELAINAAMALAPALSEFEIVAAKIYAADRRWQAAADAVTAAEEKGTTVLDGHLVRANAYRALGRNEDAANDVVAALTLDPLNIDALTLRGELQQAGVKIEAYYGDGAPK